LWNDALPLGRRTPGPSPLPPRTPQRDLAEECRRLAASTLSDQMKKRYLLMAKDYILLADVEEQSRAFHTRTELRSMQRTPEPLA
jgi:hypothetical protein